MVFVVVERGELMTDYISREAARDLMYHKQGPFTEYELDEIEAADVVPVKHGRWEKHGKHDWWCTACKIGVPYSFTGFNYCHNCGAKMDGGTDV